ncbi:MAG: hypothetical protein ACRDPK_11520 [Carbonactinosporaceae bacterium]
MRETVLWAVFACVLALVVLVGTGRPLGTALLSFAALAVLALLCYCALRLSGMKLPHLDDDE